MDSVKLSAFYDELKSKINDEEKPGSVQLTRVGGGPVGGTMEHPGAVVWRRKASKEAEKMRDNCCKHIILDIYCKILPLDNDYICGHKREMQTDIDNMLDKKNMTATQYLTSCFESTHAPLLEFIIRSSKNIAQEFMEEANKVLKDAQENDIPIPDPIAPEESEDVEGQIVDIKNDVEYETFIDMLKQKTIDKIVDDVSKIINDKKEEKDMTFDTTPQEKLATESTVAVCIDYFEKKLLMENVDITPDIQENIIGMAIRESTLNQIDLVFGHPNSDFRNFSSRVIFGKGSVINESTAKYIAETVKNCI